MGLNRWTYVHVCPGEKFRRMGSLCRTYEADRAQAAFTSVNEAYSNSVYRRRSYLYHLLHPTIVLETHENNTVGLHGIGCDTIR